MPEDDKGYTVRNSRAPRPSRIITGETPAQAREAMRKTASSDPRTALGNGYSGSKLPDHEDWRSSRIERTRMRKRAFAPSAPGYSGSPNMSFATMRPQDPMFYWQQNNMPFRMDDPLELQRIRAFCRILYMSHPLIASAVDIFSKYPLVGMELTCKSDDITDFYTELMFEQLNYEEYAVDIGREFWTVGEAWPLGSFDDELGIWEADELLNPDDVFVDSSPFLREPHFSIRLPESLRNILRTGTPPAQYAALMRSYPELKNFMGDNARMPISNHLLKQMRFKADTFNPRGIPILMRAMRAVRQEEMLNAAQDAIADRLYTPLILARLGASASDLGTPGPWVPTPGQIEDFEDALDSALAADFRVLTTHFAVQMDTVFGRETMPNLDADFERLAERQLMAFGLSKTLLVGAGTGETYAADALNRDLVSQLLTHFQRNIKRLMRDRMLICAEAAGHYDYEVRGGIKYPIMEEIRIVDEDGNDKIIEQPKLLVPQVNMRTMNLHSEQDERQFVEALAAEGVPISMKTRLVNIPIDLKDEIEQSRKEHVELAIEQAETRKETYLGLMARNLPIPQDLLTDFQPKALDAPSASADNAAAPSMRLPQIGVDDTPAPVLAPTEQDLMTPPAPTDGQAAGEQATPSASPHSAPAGGGGSGQSSRPPESDEMRAGMPRAASKQEIEDAGGAKVVKLPRSRYARNLVGEDPYVPVTEEEMAALHLASNDVIESVVMEEGQQPVEVRSSLSSGPGHIGMRRVAAYRGLVASDKPLDGEPEEESA